MLLSELLGAQPVPAQVFGVVVDCQEILPPAGLREIGVVARFVAGGHDLEDDVFDLVISCAAAKLDVVVEVPADVAIPDARELMGAAVACGFSIALLPPRGGDDAAFEAYATRLEEFVGLYAGAPNFSRFVLPVSGYLEYLFVEGIDPARAAEFAPTDEYVLENFVAGVPEGRSDAFKARMRAAFVAVYGGEEGFAELRKAIVRAVYDDARSSVEDFVRKFEEGKALAAAAGGEAPGQPGGQGGA